MEYLNGLLTSSAEQVEYINLYNSIGKQFPLQPVHSIT